MCQANVMDDADMGKWESRPGSYFVDLLQAESDSDSDQDDRDQVILEDYPPTIIQKKDQAELEDCSEKCAIQEEIQTLRDQMQVEERQMDREVELQQSRLQNFVPTPLVMVMMTITCVTDLNSQKVTPEDVIRCMEHKLFKQNSGLEVRVVKVTPRMRRLRQSFYNSVSLQCRMTSGRRIVCKLFSNGNLHCAGCQTIDDFFTVTGRVCKVLTAISGQEVSLTSYAINLINKQFNLNRHLELRDVAAALRTKVGEELLSVSYEKPFPGINAKFPLKNNKKASLMLYRRHV